MTCSIFRFAKIATLCIALLKLGGLTRAIQSVATPRAKRVLQKGGGRILRQMFLEIRNRLYCLIKNYWQAGNGADQLIKKLAANNFKQVRSF